MAKLQLSMVMGLNDRSRPVLDGSVKPDGIDLISTVAHPSEIFWRQLHFSEFDISEMSLSSLLMYIANGGREWVGLPIYTNRQFFHTGQWVRADSGIDKPEDLKGKRIGVPEYQQTAALWSRGVNLHEFGVDPMDCEWWMERTEERSHGGATNFTPPAGLKFNRIPAEENIGTMMMEGKLDAALLYIVDSNLVDRAKIVFEGNPKVRRLFPSPVAEGRRYYQKTGIFPINHGMAVRRSILEANPWVALNIFNAFRLAKEGVQKRMKELTTTHTNLGLIAPEQAGSLDIDPYPYGVKSNLKTLETVADYSFEQGLTKRRVSLEEIYAPSTLDL
jgi:4,5-dihydroxyphthalate decarboxylase